MKVANGSGKRKRAVARATVREGKGLVRINSMLLTNFNPKLLRMRILEPLIIAGELAKKVDVNVNVYGGGISSQSEASRLAIARALVDYSKDKSLREKYLSYDRHLIVADIRHTEASKPNDSKPRAKRQKSYR